MKLGVLGFVELEASAAGIPVTVWAPGRRPYLPKVNTSSALSEVLDRLVTDEQFRMEYGQPCQEYVKTNRSPEVIGASLRELWNRGSINSPKESKIERHMVDTFVYMSQPAYLLATRFLGRRFGDPLSA